MLHSDLEIQEQWTDAPLRAFWSPTPEHLFAFRRVADATVALATKGAHGALLDIAAAEGTLTCRLSLAGLTTTAVEPSPLMLATARERMSQHGTHFNLVRGIAETLPFSDGLFDRVLCHSALDHLADPERGIREMARVTHPDGRLILTFMNYGGLTVRVSRVLYAAGRALQLLSPESERRLFWDTPVPFDHNFECTLDNVTAMCRPYLELDYAHGVSLGWSFPGWGRLLEHVRSLRAWIERLDRFAQPRPALADFVVSVWRPRPRSSWPVDDYRIRPTNPVYQRLVRKEAGYWAAADFAAYFGLTGSTPTTNADLTGDPTRSWFDDLIARGPFLRVAVLGCDDLRWDADWLDRQPESRLDIYELSQGVLHKVQPRLTAAAERVRLIQADLNFAELPAAAYDCIWASGSLHCLTNLEHVINQVHRALRPGGIFAACGWVGENRMQYTAERLARVNALLNEVPSAYRRVDAVQRPSTVFQLSPFAAVRSAEILPLLHARTDFEVLHQGATGWLFPLSLVIDTVGLSRDHPAVMQHLHDAETTARGDPRLQPAMAYVVLRRK